MLQIPSGNSMDMETVVRAVDRYLIENPPPQGLVHDWAGLHYVNLFFQNKMFWEMLWACVQSFLVVLVMMTVLFRSLKWGILCMVPLSITISAIYGHRGHCGQGLRYARGRDQCALHRHCRGFCHSLSGACQKSL